MQIKVFQNHLRYAFGKFLLLNEMNRVERVEHANVKMGRKSLIETSPRGPGAKALAPHGLTYLEITTKNPQSKKIYS